MSREEPSLEEWKRLYEAAAQLQALKPWEWMEDADLFGVQNPVTGEIGYCSVMGNLGQHFALGVYLGTEGLNCLMQMGQGEVVDDPMEMLLIQKCLMASFEDRSMMEAKDRETIKALGLKFRGRNAWPQFRSYCPGYAPWYVTRQEALFLTLAIQQTLEIAPRFKEAPDLFDPKRHRQKADQFRVRVPDEAGQEWRDAWLYPAPIATETPQPPPVDEERLDRLSGTARKTPGILEMDFFFSPTGIQESKEERPWYPYLIVTLDQHSGMPLGTELARPDAIQEKFGDTLLNLLEQMGQLPKEIQVASEASFALLKPIASRLKIRLKRVRNLPMLEMMREGLFDYMG